MKEVRHVPEMRLNLISKGKLDDVGFISHFGTEKWKLAKETLSLPEVQRKDPFTLCKEEFVLEANVATDSKDVWHRRLGHMREKALHMLAKNHLPNIKGQILESCTDCIYGKQCIVGFQRSGNPLRRQKVLELVHANVCAPS